MHTDLRRAAFVEAADELFVERGFANTGVGDIARRVGVTRSLFYHYFKDKQAITDAVIDKRVDAFMAYVQNWTESLKGPTIQDALVGLVNIMRAYLTGPESLGYRIVREQDASLYHRFAVRSARLLSEYFVNSAGKSGALIEITNVRHPKESFYVLALGILNTLIEDPEVSDEVVADIMADALCIRME
ncbi:MAG: TetR/AcrR family transcriptional regulator [Atopobiaceae bacterium]|nr:TetR/AcrR family transcriptional regulator [Atopobiaceae bacterium]